MQTRIPALNELERAARRAGAKGVELLHEEWNGHRLQTEKGMLVAREEPSGSRLRLRVWLDGGREGAVEGALESGEALIDQALLAAAAAEPSEVAGPIGRLASVMGGLGIDDRRYKGIEHEDRLDVLQTAERAAKQVDRRVVPGSFWYEDRRTQRSFVNSRSVELEESDTVYRAGGSVALAGSSWPVSNHTAGRSFATVASLPFGTMAAQIAVDVAPRGERLEGDVRVLLLPEATAALVARLGEGFTMDRVTGSGFFLDPPENDDPIVDDRLHLLDDGRVTGGLRTASFDDRGVAPLPLTLLREGRVAGRFLSVERAREIDTRPTGHRVDGRLIPRNLVLRSGGRSVNVMLNEATDAVFVVPQLPDLSGLDLATGSMKVPVAGTVYRNNKQVGGMAGATLSGELMDVLNKVVEVASNTDRVGHVDAPAILLDGFALS